MSGDTFKLQKKIISAGMVWAKGMARIAVLSAKMCGVPRIFIGMARCSPEFLSPANFEKLVLPGLDYTVREFIANGITPLFHCDTNWTKFFEIFKHFPERKCILELDGRSDIFKAKEVLGDRMCIMGDVPAALLAAGTKDEVLGYCKELIQKVGADGGFILSSGCSIPANAKIENVRALMESAEKWGRYS
jgi:uroporphyrinogen-III decarboxylase